MRKFIKKAFVAVLLSCTTFAHAEDFRVDGISYNILTENTVTVTWKLGASVGSGIRIEGAGPGCFNDEHTGDVVIPSKVTYNGKTYTVTAIDGMAFKNCSKLASITMPSTIKSIGAMPFYNTPALEEVYIKDLSAWCKIDFASSWSNPLLYAKKLYVKGKLVTDLVIPKDIKVIKHAAFANGYFKSVTLHKNVENIETGAFCYCKELTSIVSKIPANKLKPIYYVFEGVDKETCVLYVPKGAKEVYASTEGWMEFKNIVEK